MAGCPVTGPAVPLAPGGPESRKTPGVGPGAARPETKSITAPFVREPSGARANGSAGACKSRVARDWSFSA